MSVKVDGEVLIPRHQWYQLLDIFTRMDEQLEVMIKLQDRTNRLLESIARSLGAMPTAPTAVTVVEEALNNRYKVFKLDLSIARDNQPLGLSDMGIVAKSVTVTRLDSPASWRRNDPILGEVEELSVGYHVSNFEIRELFITNAAGTGYLTIVLEWRE
jgi:hypothetical protein